MSAPDSGLARLIALWDATRDGRIPRLVRVLDADRGPESLAARIAGVLDGHPRAPIAAQRVRDLGGRADPRLADACVHWLMELPYRTWPSADPFWDAVFTLLAESAGPELEREALADAVIGRHAIHTAVRVGERVRTLAIPPAMRGPTADEDAWLEALVAEHPVPPDEEPRGEQDDEALLARVHADPDDDTALRVLADRLQQRGDPRGELIALQLAPAGHRDRVREQDLLLAHRADWAGPWLPLMGDLGFERGFLRRVHLARRLGNLGKLVGDAHLATVRCLTVSSRPDPRVVRGVTRILAHPVTAGLRELGTFAPADLDALAEVAGDRITRLRTFFAGDDTEGLIARLGRWPRLVHLGVEVATDVPEGAILELLARAAVPSVGLHLWTRTSTPPFAEWMAAAHPGTETLRSHTPSGTVLCASRGTSGGFERFRCELERDGLVFDVYAQLPAPPPPVLVPSPDAPSPRVFLGDWGLAPRLAELGPIQRLIYTGDLDRLPDARTLPPVADLELQIHRDQHDYSGIVRALAGAPVDRVRVAQSIDLTAGPTGAFDQGLLHPRWTEGWSRRIVERVLPLVAALGQLPGSPVPDAELQEVLTGHGLARIPTPM